MDKNGASIHALIERRAHLIHERSRLDAEIKHLEVKIESYRAIERARWAGLRITPKTESKALHWGFILNTLETSGPLPTSRLCELASVYLETDNYSTIRSHLHRMAIEGLIEQNREKRWIPTKRASETRAANWPPMLF